MPVQALSARLIAAGVPSSLLTPESALLLALLAFFSLLVARFVAGYLSRVAPSPQQDMEPAPAPEPVLCGELTLQELRAFDGSDPAKPLYLVR